jgi:hypothetical protein
MHCHSGKRFAKNQELLIPNNTDPTITDQPCRAPHLDEKEYNVDSTAQTNSIIRNAIELNDVSTSIVDARKSIKTVGREL